MSEQDSDDKGKIDEPVLPYESGGDWEWNEEDFAAKDEEALEPPAYQKWIKRAVVAFVALALAGNMFAAIPLIYNLNVIQFLKKTRELQQNETLQQYKQAIVVVKSGDSKGTGFNIDERGLIVTNEHVVEGESIAVIGFPDGTTYRAIVTKSDPELDLAMLQVEGAAESLPTLEIETGQVRYENLPVYYIGNPYFFNHIMGEGTVLGLTPIEGRPSEVLMLDAPIYKGNSGSPVIGPEGKVIAVIYATSERRIGSQLVKVGLAVPMTEFERFTKS